MSSFTNILKVTPMSNGKNWALLDSFNYDVGAINSGETIEVGKGFITDFATIPRLLWIFLPKWGKYGNAAVVHDYLYWIQKDYNRRRADDIMWEGMEVMEVSFWKKWPIYIAVRTFGWWAWRRNGVKKKKGIPRFVDVDKLDSDGAAAYQSPGMVKMIFQKDRKPDQTAMTAQSEEQAMEVLDMLNKSKGYDAYSYSNTSPELDLDEIFDEEPVTRSGSGSGRSRSVSAPGSTATEVLSTAMEEVDQEELEYVVSTYQVWDGTSPMK